MVYDIPRHRVRFDEFRRGFLDEPWPLEVRSPSSVSFESVFTSRVLGSFPISHARSAEHSIEQPEPGGGGPDALRLIHIQLAGRSVFTQDGQGIEIKPGDIATYDTSHPYLSENLGGEVLVLGVPNRLFGLPSHRLSELGGVGLDRDRLQVRLVHPLATLLTTSLHELDDSVGGRLVLSAVELISAAFIELGESASDRAVGHRLLAVLEYIEANLSRPHLTVSEIAAAHFMSPRGLHALFEEHETTVAAWVRSRRLENCRRDLADSAFAEVRIAEIAGRWGFTDPAHFSRLFAHRFGVSPRVFRARATKGV